MEVYRHSGKMPLIGIPLTVFLGAATAAVLGLVYSYIIVYDPIIYINMMCTLGFGYCIGLSVAKGVRLGKIRNPVLAGAYGLAFGLAGLYIAWVADYWARVAFDLAAFDPDELKEYISWFYENGMWTISNHGNGGDTVKGIVLGGVWIVEASIIVGFATVQAYKSVASIPFCEPCNAWTKDNLGAARLKFNPEIQRRLAAGDLLALDEALAASGREDVFTQLDLHCCPKCDNSIFLSVCSMKTTVDKKGNRKSVKKILLRYMVLSGADVPRVLEAGRRVNMPETGEKPS
jgi:hypothetical protein